MRSNDNAMGVLADGRAHGAAVRLAEEARDAVMRRAGFAVDFLG
jgi:hypothetical protein